MKIDQALEKNEPVANGTDKSRILVEIIEYAPGALPVKTIVRKTKSDVSSVSFSSDDVFGSKKSSDDIWMLVLEGSIEILIEQVADTHYTGQWLFVASGLETKLKPHGAFKLMAVSSRTAQVN